MKSLFACSVFYLKRGFLVDEIKGIRNLFRGAANCARKPRKRCILLFSLYDVIIRSYTPPAFLLR